ncbi:hypothetical protein Dimus_011417 [Dionaea muscipula]
MILHLKSHLSQTLAFPQFHPNQRRPTNSPRPSFSNPINPIPLVKPALKCSASVLSEKTHVELTHAKPFPAEVSRTIMELSSAGTLSTLTHDGWPLAFAVRLTVDGDGTPIVCLNASDRDLSFDRRSSLHVQLGQCGVRTPQCTIQGSLAKPRDRMILKKLCSIWEKRFEEEANEDRIHIVTVGRVLHIEDFQEDGVWLTSSDYKNANPDPLRDVAGRIVNEFNANNMEDILRFCSVYVDLQFQVADAKMVWVDRLGFDVHVYSPEYGIYEIRIPFPREVSDEKGVKSSFNGMSQLAWEVEKYYHVPDFKKVKQLKQIAPRSRSRPSSR